MEEEEELDELGSELVKQSLKEVAEEIAQSKSDGFLH